MKRVVGTRGQPFEGKNESVISRECVPEIVAHHTLF